MLGRMAEREVGGWIWPENKMGLMKWLAVYIGYGFSESDEIAVANAADGCFEYPLAGNPPLLVALEPDDEADPVSVRVTGAMDNVLAARVETLLDVFSDARSER